MWMVRVKGKSWPNGRQSQHNRKVASSSLGPAGIVGGGSDCTALSPPLIPRLRFP